MRIGTMFLGKVDALGEESIQTKFFVLGVPLLPLSSHYVLSEQVNGNRGFEIPLHGKSVLLGYARIFAWLGAALMGLFAYLERHDPASLWLTCAVLAATAVGTTFFLGGLSGAEKVRRSMLKAITGVGAPPALLPSSVVDGTSKRLLAVWREEHEDESWDAAAATGKAEPLLYALAEYHRREDLAERVLAQLLAGDAKPAGGPYRGTAR